METVARIRGLHAGFNGRTVLRSVDLEIGRGEITVVVGPSGSGKTTLLRSLNRLNDLVPGFCGEGLVELNLDGSWVDVSAPGGIDPAALRRRVGMVFQTPHVLPLSIEKNLSLPLRLVARLDRAGTRDRIERSLRDAGLFDEVKDRLSESALSLSGGQQQRLCLARALALEPDFLLLDEPTASLDVRAARRIEELLLQLKRRYTIVAVSHGLAQARRLADRVVVLRDGGILERLDRRELAEPNVLERLLDEVDG
jgi:phosphate transport system ATP-binding protein